MNSDQARVAFGDLVRSRFGYYPQLLPDGSYIRSFDQTLWEFYKQGLVGFPSTSKAQKVAVKLTFSEEVPTETGYYLLSYIGAKSGKEKFDLVKLGMKPANYNWRTDGPVLCFEQDGQLDDEPMYHEINFHADCGTVLWSQRIEKPIRTVASSEAEGELKP